MTKVIKDIKWSLTKGKVSKGTWFVLGAFGNYLGPFEATNIIRKGTKKIKVEFMHEGKKDYCLYQAARSVQIKK